jgi:signal transduction histidine kinase
MKKLVFTSVGILLAVLVGALLTFQGARRVSAFQGQRQDAQVVLGLMEETFSDLKDAETGQRGFLITRDESFLAPYLAGCEQYRKDVAELRSHALGGAERERLATLETLASAKLQELSGTVQAVRRGDRDAAGLILQAKGKLLMDRVREARRSLIEDQVARINALDQQAVTSSRRGALEQGVLMILIFLGVLMASFTLARAMVHLRREVVARAQGEAEVLQLNGRLETSNQELEAFAFSVSHDLRAPLRHVDGFAELLRKNLEGKLPENASHYLDVIQGAAKRMGALIDDLLGYSRLGRAELHRQPVPLGPLVQQVRAELGSGCEGRAVDWEIGPLPTVSGDPILLREAIRNLLGNALKFTRDRPEARIQVGSRPEAGITLFVQDNGVGFDMQYREKLFRVFSRLHGQDEFEGTGIGLANVARVAAKHGGRVWAVGEVDGGATFFMNLKGV